MKNTCSAPNQLKQRGDEGDLEAMYDYGRIAFPEISCKRRV